MSFIPKGSGFLAAIYVSLTLHLFSFPIHSKLALNNLNRPYTIFNSIQPIKHYENIMPSNQYPSGYSYSRIDQCISTEQFVRTATAFYQHLASLSLSSSSSNNSDAGTPEVDHTLTTSIKPQDSLPPLVDQFDTVSTHEDMKIVLSLCDNDLAPNTPNGAITQLVTAANDRSLAIDNPGRTTLRTLPHTSAQHQSYKPKHSGECVRNLTNRHVALIQWMRHTQNLTKEHITEYLFSEFPGLRGGPWIDEETREVVIRGLVELQCSIGAPRYTFGLGIVEVAIDRPMHWCLEDEF